MPITTFDKELYQKRLVGGHYISISTGAVGQPGTISFSGDDMYVAGNNVTISTSAGQSSTISAINTTYLPFYIEGPGLVPPVTTADNYSFLRGDGSWVAVDLSNSYVAGANVTISTASGQPSTISATDTTYVDFTSSTNGLVPSPNGSATNSFLKNDGTWSTISQGETYEAGGNITLSTASGQPTTISAIDTTYTDFSGGNHGLVPSVSTQTGKFLKDDGTWDTINNSGAISSLTDVSLTNVTNGQILKYNTTSQKWENANETTGVVYSPGANIQISNQNVISATDTTYSQGTNISISAQNEISAVDTTYAAFTSNTSGLVPSPASAPANSYLKSDGSWSTITVGDSYVAGSNINISTASGQPSTISAIDTTYTNFSGSTSGLVPPATVSGDTSKYLKGDGSWDEPPITTVIANPSGSATSTLSKLQIENTIYTIPNSAVTNINDLEDVSISSATNGQVLTYNSTTQKWINSTPGGGGGGIQTLSGTTAPSSATGNNGDLYFEVDANYNVKKSYVKLNNDWREYGKGGETYYTNNAVVGFGNNLGNAMGLEGVINE